MVRVKRRGLCEALSLIQCKSLSEDDVYRLPTTVFFNHCTSRNQERDTPLSLTGNY